MRCILLLTWMLAAACAARAGEPRLHATLTMATSSDWSRFEVQDPSAVLAPRRIEQGAEAPGLHILHDGLHKKAYDATCVRLSFDLLVESPSALSFHVRKGAIGITTLTLGCAGGGVSVQPGIRGEQGHVRFAANALDKAPRVDLDRPLFPPRVLTFYYPWYGSPGGPEQRRFHWDAGYTHTPFLGEYSSRSARTVDRHIEWMNRAGVETFIASWWGPNSYEDVTLREYVLPRLNDDAPSFCLYLEVAGSTADLMRQLIYIYENYAQHPCHLRIDDRPVVFIYVRVMNELSPEQFGTVFARLAADGHAFFTVADSLSGHWLDVFDGLHTYNPVVTVRDAPAALVRMYRAAGAAAHLRGKLFVGTALPGYDDSHIGRPTPIVLDRRDGATYRETWAAARAGWAPWIAVTSWNEWHEGSDIEPSAEFGEAYLDMTARIAAELHQQAPLK